VILGFTGPHRFLSNFWEAPQTIDGITFPTNEHFFAWSKTSDPISKSDILNCSTPGAAKRAGKHVRLRYDWEVVKDDIMLRGLRAKFGQNLHLADMLCATGREYLEETNKWGDRYWGVDGTGFNRLGILLMLVRAELQTARR
jgi:ribA/ribD-fused uncharacterized protein